MHHSCAHNFVNTKRAPPWTPTGAFPWTPHRWERAAYISIWTRRQTLFISQSDGLNLRIVLKLCCVVEPFECVRIFGYALRKYWEV